MPNTASRTKAANADSSVNANVNNSAKTNTNSNKANGKNANVVSTSAHVKPTSAMATATGTATPKQTTTVAATPTPAVQSAGANANKKGKNVVNVKTNAIVNANAAAKGNKIGKTNNAAAPANNAKPTNAKATATDKTNQPVTANTNVKNATATNTNSRVNDSRAVGKSAKPKSANAAKTNEKTKAKTNGKINAKINAKLEVHTVGVSFVLRLVLGLAPEKRADCQILREILSHESRSRLVITSSGKGLKPASGVSTAANAKEWAKLSQDQRRQVARQAQSDKFQEAMQQLGGERLYASIRTQLSQASDEFVWDASKDKPALQQAKVVRPRSGSADDKNKSRSSKASKETAMWSKVPPPAPVSVKSTPVKKNTALKTSGQVKNASPMKNGTPVKNVSADGAWGGAVPASIVQSRPGAIVRNAPTFSARAGNGGRAILSRAL